MQFLMKFKSILVFLILGGSVIFVGLPVKEYIPREINVEKNPVISESLVLLSILSILGVGIFIVIQMLEIILDKKLLVDMLKHANRNPRAYYTF